MPSPEFSRLEEQLRTFFGRCCTELSSHVPDPIATFVRPVLTKKRPNSLDNLEYTDYCRILVKNLKVPQEGVRLFDRYDVSDTMIADLWYCQSLRNKYSHLKGLKQAVSSKEQYSDLTVVRRAVHNLLRVRTSGDADKKLLADLDRALDALLELIAEGSLPESHQPTSPGPMSDEEKRQFAALVASVVASRSSGTADGGPSCPKILAEVVETLFGLRTDVGHLASQLALLDDLPEQVDTSTQALEHAFERLSNELRGLATVPPTDAPAVALSGVPPTIGDDEYTSDTDLDMLLEQLSEAQSARSTHQRHRTPPEHVPLTVDEARDDLVRLRRKIWKETQSRASADGLLRKRLLDAFLRYRPTTQEDVYDGPLSTLMLGVDPRQEKYLPEVLSVIRRIVD